MGSHTQHGIQFGGLWSAFTASSRKLVAMNTVIAWGSLYCPWFVDTMRFRNHTFDQWNCSIQWSCSLMGSRNTLALVHRAHPLLGAGWRLYGVLAWQHKYYRGKTNFHIKLETFVESQNAGYFAMVRRKSDGLTRCSYQLLYLQVNGNCVERDAYTQCILYTSPDKTSTWSLCTCINIGGVVAL